MNFKSDYDTVVKAVNRELAATQSVSAGLFQGYDIAKAATETALNDHVATQTQLIESGHASNISSLQQQLQQNVNAINNALQQQLKQFDKNRKKMILNGGLVIGSAVVFFVAPHTLVSSVGNFAASAIQFSAGMSALEAVNNFINGTGNVGFSFTVPLYEASSKTFVPQSYVPASEWGLQGDGAGFPRSDGRRDGFGTEREWGDGESGAMYGVRGSASSVVHNSGGHGSGAMYPARGSASNAAHNSGWHGDTKDLLFRSQLSYGTGALTGNSSAFAGNMQPHANISFGTQESGSFGTAGAMPQSTLRPAPELRATQGGVIDWAQLALRSLGGEKSAAVANWQLNNRDMFPGTAAFFDSIAQSKPQKVVNAFLDQFTYSLEKPVMFVAEELERKKLGEPTKTSEFFISAVEDAKSIKEFIALETARLVAGDTTETGRFFDKVSDFVNADVDRLRSGHATVIGTAIAQEFQALAEMSPEELAGYLGHEAGETVLFLLAGGGVGAAGRVMTKGVETVCAASKGFIAANEVRTPFTIRFEPGKLHSGFPIDAVKPQRPVIKWSVKSRMKAAKLPNEGRIRFVPRENYRPDNILPRGENNGYLDRFDNEWIKGPSRTPGEPFEWDVQLSDLGRDHLGWASRDGKHINVSLKGELTHR